MKMTKKYKKLNETFNIDDSEEIIHPEVEEVTPEIIQKEKRSVIDDI